MCFVYQKILFLSILFYHDVVADFETVVGEDKLFKVLGQPAVLADVGLKAGHAIVPDDEP